MLSSLGSFTSNCCGPRKSQGGHKAIGAEAGVLDPTLMKIATKLFDSLAPPIQRVTIRMDGPQSWCPCPVVAEVLNCDYDSDQAPSIANIAVPGLETAKTYLYMKDVCVEGDALLQADLQNMLDHPELYSEAEPFPPKVLVNDYKTKAQMLSPIKVDGTLRGIVSVHSAVPRSWSDDGRQLIIDAAKDARQTLF